MATVLILTGYAKGYEETKRYCIRSNYNISATIFEVVLVHCRHTAYII
jgi:hypothetical protein